MRIYPEKLKRQALILRLKGYSYTEINKTLQVSIPKNTYTGWFKGVLLSDQAKLRIIERIRISGAPGRAIAWQNIRRKREELLLSIRDKAELETPKSIDTTISKICLAMLYLGEGAKVGEFIKFGNSDPKVIELFITLLRKSFLLDENKLKGRVQCRADQNTKELEKYWSKITNIPLAGFTKPLIDKRTIGKPTLKLNYKGVFVIEYYSNRLFLELKFISDIIYSRVMGL